MGVEHVPEAEDCLSSTQNAPLRPKSQCWGAALAVAASADVLGYAALHENSEY